MIRSLGMTISLLTIGLLMSAGPASARAGECFVSTLGSAAQIRAVATAVSPYQILTILGSPIYTAGGDRDRDDNHGGGDRDRDKNHGGGDRDRDKNNGGGEGRGDGTAPTPEPSTILSFGAALLIGGGVLYSRRLRANKK
jgi:hypothetical protein